MTVVEVNKVRAPVVSRPLTAMWTPSRAFQGPCCQDMVACQENQGNSHCRGCAFPETDRDFDSTPLALMPPSSRGKVHGAPCEHSRSAGAKLPDQRKRIQKSWEIGHCNGHAHGLRSLQGAEQCPVENSSVLPRNRVSIHGYHRHGLSLRNARLRRFRFLRPESELNADV